MVSFTIVFIVKEMNRMNNKVHRKKQSHGGLCNYEIKFKYYSMGIGCENVFTESEHKQGKSFGKKEK